MNLIALASLSLVLRCAEASSRWLSCCFSPLDSVSDQSSPETFFVHPNLQREPSKEQQERDLRIDMEVISNAADFLSVSSASEDEKETDPDQVHEDLGYVSLVNLAAAGSEVRQEEPAPNPITDDQSLPEASIHFEKLETIVEEKSSDISLSTEGDRPSSQTESKGEVQQSVTESKPSVRRGLSQTLGGIPSTEWQGYPLKYFKPLIEGKVYDYQVSIPAIEMIKPSQRSRAVTFNPYFLNLPRVSLGYFTSVHFDLFATLFPGLKETPMTSRDIAGLLTFGVLVSFADDYTFFPQKFHDFVYSMRVNFDIESEILNHFATNQVENLFSVKSALSALFKLAMETDCFYTVEAFFYTRKEKFDHVNLYASIEASARTGSTKIYNRIAGEILQVDSIAVAHRAVKHCAMAVFEQVFVETDGLIVRDVQTRYEIDSLFTLLVEQKCHSYSLLSHSVWSDEDLDAGMLASIKVGNWKMFKTLIENDWHQYPSLDPVMIQALKIVFGASDATLGKFLATQVIEDVFFVKLIEIILMLDCPEAVVISNFSWIIQQLPFSVDAPIFGQSNPLQRSMFLKTREYMGAICVFGSFQAIRKLENGSSTAVWDIIKGARDYELLMENFIHSPNYRLLHSFANPNLTSKNWKSIFCKNQVDTPLVHKASLQTLVDNYGFDAEIIAPTDYAALNLVEEKLWTMLHLAVVAFNVRLVDALLDAGSSIDERLSLADSRTPLDLAKELLTFLENPGYLRRHQMQNALIRADLRNEMRLKHPEFYLLDQDPTSATHIRNRAIINCRAIISRLTFYQEGAAKIKAKSLYASEDEDEDFDI